MLKELNKKLKLTIILVTHEMNVVRAICDEVCYIENGKVSNLYSVEEFFIKDAKNFSLYLKDYKNKTDIFYKLAKILKYPYEIISTNYYEFNDEKTTQIDILINNFDENIFLNYLNFNNIIFKQKGK